MKKKTNIRQVIRKIVREEVAMAIQEVITEMKKPTQQVSQPKQQLKNEVVEKREYTKNSILNDVLNETAMNEEWKTMGGGTYDSNRANEIMSNEYGDMMNEKPTGDQAVASMGVDPSTVPDDVKNALTRDYSGLMKAIDKKRGSK